MKKIFLLFFCMTLAVVAKQNFYYSFIDSDFKQISQEDKDIIIDGFVVLENVKKIMKDGKIHEAYGRLKSFKNRTNIELLRSDIILLESELLLKKESKRFILEGEQLLEGAINRSYINEDDLPRAYMILIELKLKLNKINEAKYFIDTITNNFNTDIIKAYGGIYLAKLHVHKSEYKQAINTLYEILIKTTNIDVATVVADELFDVYLLDKQVEKAYEIGKQVLERNIDYYANDNYLAMQKINKLVKNDMPKLAVEILEELLKRTRNSEAIEEFKFELAQTYMLMYKGDMSILDKAKELYSEVLNAYPKGKNAKAAKMIIDEILMRERKIEPSLVSSKYSESPLMQQKVLMQEILNYIKNEEYETILKSESVYKKISETIFKRFGYENSQTLFDNVRLLFLRQYLLNGNCQNIEVVLIKSTKNTLERVVFDENLDDANKDALTKAIFDENLHETNKDALAKVIFDENLHEAYFECLLEYPKEENYNLTKEALFNSRDAKTYLYLEQLALKLHKYDEAMGFSEKVEMLNESKYLEEEFLVRFQIVHNMKNQLTTKIFFNYANKNPQLININENNPIIIDFYYQYYFYLLNENKIEEALSILNKLYLKQKEYQAYIYSPSVEIELAKHAKNNTNIEQSIAYLQEGIKNTRNIKNNELAEIYYEMTKLYELTNNDAMYNEALSKCKALDSSTTSLYKKICDEL